MWPGCHVFNVRGRLLPGSEAVGGSRPAARQRGRAASKEKVVREATRPCSVMNDCPGGNWAVLDDLGVRGEDNENSQTPRKLSLMKVRY